MSWMEQLYQTYEKNIGRDFDEEIALTPIAHIDAKAQVEVTLNGQGELLNARSLKKEENRTLIPVTEASASRSSGITPHALCDTLSYIAGDYAQYCNKDKERRKAKEKFDSYMTQLKKWVDSVYTHPKVQAIYRYLAREQLLGDLIRSDIVELDDNGYLTDKKIEGQPYEKTLVRFRVLGGDVQYSDKTWQDETLIQTYTNYYLSEQNGRIDICYLLGENKTTSENHPKGIVAANYGAKLISANDGQGFTYRGRFQDVHQAYALSYEASQKVHSALTWLVQKQGAYVGIQDKRTFICWSPQGKKTPDILEAFSFDEDEFDSDESISYRKRLIRTFQGFQDQFEKDDNVIIMGLDAATTGRLSITYYQELPASEFWERIVYWGSTCSWIFRKYTESRGYYYVQETPIFRRIVQCAFGRESSEYLDIDDRILKEQTQRLLKCMLDRQPLPRDILQALVQRASTPMAYNRRNREMILSTTCAVITKYRCDRESIKEGECFMKLDVQNHDRSYLFGRLLAVLEKLERDTYDRDENREPNAIRLQATYINHPMQTWHTLHTLLDPYLQKLNPGLREYYRRLITEITVMILEEDEQILNQSLKDSYLLGYYLQRAELYTGKEKKEENENE